MRSPGHGSQGQGWHPRSRVMAVDGWPAHYVDMGGSGPPILLLHGILVSSWAWRFNLGPLSRRFRVLALCQKGFGWSGRGSDPYTFESLASFVVGFLDRLGLPQVDLVGNSLGGAVSLQVALDHPGRVRRLVLVNAAAAPYPLGDVLRLQSPALAPVYRLVGRRSLFRLLLRTLAYRGLEVNDVYMDGFMEPLRAPATLETAAAVARNLQPGLRALVSRLPEVRHRSLLVWGARDLLVPMRVARLLHRALPDARLAVFERSAHCPMEEEPARFNELLAEFLADQEAEDGGALDEVLRTG